MTAPRPPSILESWDELTRAVRPPSVHARMSSRTSLPVGALATAAVVIAVLALLPPRPAVSPGSSTDPTASARPTNSRIVTGPDGLRTFTFMLEFDGIPVACPGFGLVDPVRGTLDGMPGAREPVWIRTDDGRLLSVVWPAGFTVRFEPNAFLYSDRGNVVAGEGQAIELGQTRWESAAGTYEDPYLAQGAVFGGCYPFSSDIPQR